MKFVLGLLSVVAAGDPTSAQSAVAALAEARDAHSITHLWLASFDPEAQVRQSALAAVQTRCGHESPPLCTAMLGFFADDALVDIGWAARDAMLALDPHAALVSASQAYKLEVLTEMGGNLRLPAAQVSKVLGILVTDPDPAVQENAAWLLENTP